MPCVVQMHERLLMILNLASTQPCGPEDDYAAQFFERKDVALRVKAPQLAVGDEVKRGAGDDARGRDVKEWVIGLQDLSRFDRSPPRPR